jgi:hypothetical protein
VQPKSAAAADDVIEMSNVREAVLCALMATSWAGTVMIVVLQLVTVAV